MIRVPVPDKALDAPMFRVPTATPVLPQMFPVLLIVHVPASVLNNDMSGTLIFPLSTPAPFDPPRMSNWNCEAPEILPLIVSSPESDCKPRFAGPLTVIGPFQ